MKKETKEEVQVALNTFAVEELRKAHESTTATLKEDIREVKNDVKGVNTKLWLIIAYLSTAGIVNYQQVENFLKFTISILRNFV